MAANYNKVILMGRLTGDPELKYTPNGTARTKFRIAVNRTYKDSAGQLQEEVDFVPIVTWGSQAENCNQYLSKGRPVLVDGRLSIREFKGDDGENVRWTEVVANTVQFLGSRQENDGTKAVDFGDGDEVPF